MPGLDIVYDSYAKKQLQALDAVGQTQIKHAIDKDVPYLERAAEFYSKNRWATLSSGSIRRITSQHFEILVRLEFDKDRVVILNILNKDGAKIPPTASAAAADIIRHIKPDISLNIGFTLTTEKQFLALNYEIQRLLTDELAKLYTNVFTHDDGAEDYFRFESGGYMVLTRVDRKRNSLTVLNIELSEVEAKPESWRIEFDKTGRRHFDKLDSATQAQIWRELHTTLVEELNRQPEIKDHDILNYFWPSRCVNDEYRVLCVLNSAEKTACVLDIEYRPIPGR